jgi:hypothetical protein
MNVKIRFTQVLRRNYRLVLLVYATFIVMVRVSFFYVSRIVSHQMLMIGEETMNTTEAAVTASLSENQLSFTNIAQMTEDMLLTGRSNEEILAFLAEMNVYFGSGHEARPEFMKVFAYIRGEFLD